MKPENLFTMQTPAKMMKYKSSSRARISSMQQLEEVTRPKKGNTTNEDDSSDRSTVTMQDNDSGLSDEETVVGGIAGRTPDLTTTRCTLKLQMTGGTNAFGRAINLIKEFLTQVQTFDRRAYISPWYENGRQGISNVKD